MLSDMPLAPAGVMFHKSNVESVSHEDCTSSVQCQDGTQLIGRIVLDATGHARKLIEFDKKFDPGYQVGFTCSRACAHSHR